VWTFIVLKISWNSILGSCLVLHGFQSYVLKIFYAGWMYLFLYLGQARTFYVRTGRDSEIDSNCHVVSMFVIVD
jgi:hypothetical protein